MFLVDWLFPIKCYRCNQPGEYLCNSCQGEIRLLKEQFCSVCNKPSPNGLVHVHKNYLIERLISLYAYQSPLKEMLQDYKYHQVRGIKSVLVELLKKGMRKNKLTDYWRKNKFVFIPVPLHPLKELHRGFNQAGAILVDACRQLDLRCETDWIKRVKWTKTQTKLSLPARKDNLKKAFKVDFEKIKPNLNLVIFDDVYTSGSTLLSCAKAFQNKKINTIHGLTLLRRL